MKNEMIVFLCSLPIWAFLTLGTLKDIGQKKLAEGSSKEALLVIIFFSMAFMYISRCFVSLFIRGMVL